MSLENQIRAFISKVPRGCIFDAHAVITYLIEKFPDDYLGFYTVGESMHSFHGRICQEIDRLADGILIKRVGNAYSKNIKGEFSGNACWEK